MRDEDIFEQKSFTKKSMFKGSILKGSIISQKNKAETLNNDTEYCGITESISPSQAEELGMDLDFEGKA